MKARDRKLGMDRAISRRDFMQGAVGAAITAGALAAGCGAEQGGGTPGPVGLGRPPSGAAGYPPTRLGLRGTHAGAFEIAHQMAFEKRTDWGPSVAPDEGEYDLVVVGAGVSGLAAAFFHLEKHPDARILLLENHDDFGGHAKRNEFEWEGRTILGYGGSQSLEAPGSYSDVAIGLLERIGVEPKRLADAYDQSFYQRHDLAAGLYFDRDHYGSDRLVRTDLIDASGFIPMARAGDTPDAAIDRMPLDEAARVELKRLFAGGDDVLPDHSVLSEPDYLGRITYLDFLQKHVGIRHPQTIALLQDLPSNYFGQGIDVRSALEVMGFGLPGLGFTGLGLFEGALRKAIPYLIEPYVYHFPDGNASVARLLVRRLIPEVAPGSTMHDIVGADFDYSKLDRPESSVRLRLGSTVVRVQHEGDPKTAEGVGLTYVRDGRTETVRAKQVVLACYNMAIPYLCPELPAEQRDALASLVKMPLVYTSVLLRNWRAWNELGIGLAQSPGRFHKFAMLDFPVSMPGYGFSASPDDPIVVHLAATVTVPGLPPREQARAGRYKLLGLPFEAMERELREHLGGMLSGGGFDPARDIAAIAVNRWPHGYSFETSPIFDPEYGPGEAPHEIGRRRFGRIAIANSDAGARAYLDEAIDQAWRAVNELG